MKTTILEFSLPKHQCPDGDWEPIVYDRQENGARVVWAVSVWPFLTHIRLTEQAGVYWMAPLGACPVESPGSKIEAEKIVAGEVVTVRLVRCTLED